MGCIRRGFEPFGISDHDPELLSFSDGMFCRRCGVRCTGEDAVRMGYVSPMNARSTSDLAETPDSFRERQYKNWRAIQSAMNEMGA
jgi:hypothetical protein